MPTYTGYSTFQKSQLDTVDTNLTSLETLIQSNEARLSGPTGYVVSNNASVNTLGAGITGTRADYNAYVIYNNDRVQAVTDGLTGYIASSTAVLTSLGATDAAHHDEFLEYSEGVTGTLAFLGATGAALHDEFLEYSTDVTGQLGAFGVGLESRIIDLETRFNGPTGINAKIDNILGVQLPAKLTNDTAWNNFITDMQTADTAANNLLLEKTATVIKNQIDADQTAKIQGLIDFVNLTLKTYKIFDENNNEYIFPLAPTAISLSYNTTTYTISYSDVPTNLRGQPVTLVQVNLQGSQHTSNTEYGTITLSSTGEGSFEISTLNKRPFIGHSLGIKSGNNLVDINPTSGLYISDVPWMITTSKVVFDFNSTGDLIFVSKEANFNPTNLSLTLLNQDNVPYAQGVLDQDFFSASSADPIIFSQQLLQTYGITAGSIVKFGIGDNVKMIFSDPKTYTYIPPYIEPTAWALIGANMTTGNTTSISNANNNRGLAYDSNTKTLYYGGSFTSVAGVTVQGVAKYDVITDTWSSAGNNLTGFNVIKALSNGYVVFGGTNVTYNNIAVWNGTTLMHLGGGVSGPVFGLEEDTDGNLLVGGTFINCRNTINGSDIVCNRIAKWNFNTQSWETFGDGIQVSGSEVQSIIRLDNGNLLASGFNIQNVQVWNGSTWSILVSFNTGYVTKFARLINGDILFCGSFGQINSVSYSSIARYNQNNGQFSSFKSGIGGMIRDASVLSNGDVIVVGDFTSANNGTGNITINRIARWNSSTQLWSEVGKGTTSAIRSVETSIINNELTIYISGMITSNVTQSDNTTLTVPGIAKFD